MQMEIFCKVKDPRVLGKGKHELEDVLRMALIGVLCSCDDYDEISDLIEDKEDEFKRMGFLKLSNGVPSGDTVRRVVESVSPDEMRAVCQSAGNTSSRRSRDATSSSTGRNTVAKILPAGYATASIY